MNIQSGFRAPVVACALVMGCAAVLAGCTGSPNQSLTQPQSTAVTAAPDAGSELAVAPVTPRGKPATVVGLSGRNVVLDQGSDVLEVGTLYRAVRVGAAGAADPSWAPCCSIQVDRIDAGHAWGHIVDAGFREAGKFVPRSIELRAPVPLQGTVAVTARIAATN